MNHPRVLYLADRPIGHSDGIGHSMANLYRDWPADSLLQIVLHAGDSATPANVVLGDDRVLIRRARAAISSIRPGAQRSRASEQVARPIRNNPFIRDGRSVSPLSSANWEAICDLSPETLPRVVIPTVKAFGPEVIHSPLGSIRLMRLSHRLARLLAVPVVPHFMDDWLHSIYCNGELAGLAHRYGNYWVKKVLAAAPMLLTIGEAMANEFAARYHRPTVAVGNCVEPEDFAKPLSWSPGHSAPRRIIYAGGVHLGRADVLVATAHALRETASNWTVQVLTGAAGAATLKLLEPPTNLVVQPCLPADQLPDILRRADALLFVESERPEYADYTRFSVSTKVPEFLASGVPVLVVGPDEQASIRLLVANGGRKVHPDDPGGLVATLEEITGAAASRPSLPDVLSCPVVRRRFREALSNAVDPS